MNRKQRETGAILPLVAIAMVTLFGFMALALDVGLMMWRKSQFQTAIDAAALSAAFCKYVKNDTEADAKECGDDTYTYNLRAYGFLEPTDEASVDDYQWHDDDYYVDAFVSKPDNHTFFAGVVGFDTFSVTVASRAGVTGELSEPVGAMPLLVDKKMMCGNTRWDEDCQEENYKNEWVQALALIKPLGSYDFPSKQEVEDWFSGEKEMEVSAGTSYRLCIDGAGWADDLCERPYDYEDAIEDGIEKRVTDPDKLYITAAIGEFSLWRNNFDHPWEVDDDHFKGWGKVEEVGCFKMFSLEDLTDPQIQQHIEFDDRGKEGEFEIDDPEEWEGKIDIEWEKGKWDDGEWEPAEWEIEGIWLKYIPETLEGGATNPVYTENCLTNTDDSNNGEPRKLVLMGGG